MTRVSVTVSSSLPGTAAKPGANSLTRTGASHQPTAQIVRRTRPSAQNSCRPSVQASASPWVLSACVKVGTNAEDIAPSAKRSRSRLGMRNATLKASVAKPAPNRGGHHLLAHQAEDSRQQRGRADGAGVARDLDVLAHRGAERCHPSTTMLAFGVMFLSNAPGARGVPGAGRLLRHAWPRIERYRRRQREDPLSVRALRCLTGSRSSCWASSKG